MKAFCWEIRIAIEHQKKGTAGEEIFSSVNRPVYGGGKMKEKRESADEVQKEGNVFSTFFRKTNDGFLGLIHRYDVAILLVIVTILGILMRIALFPCVRNDYNNFLLPWYTNIYENGASALGGQYGDYTPAYNYFLAILTLFRFEPGELVPLFSMEIDPVLWGIKTISCLFDFGLAIYVYLIVHKVTGSSLKAALGYTLVVFGLTVFLNSALWGQCDAIYVFFLIGSLYYLLTNRQHLSFIFLGLSFCFKLQAIFALPAFFVLYLKKQVKLRYFLYIPLVYLIVALPACFAAGEDFFTRLIEIIMVYPNQMGSYQYVAMNAGSFYALIFTNFKVEEYISSFALFLAIIVNGVLIFLLMRYKHPFEGKTIIKVFLLFSMTMPYFMPHMHERYFYFADILVAVYLILNVKKFLVYLFAMANSMIGYMVYLWNVPFFNVVPQDGEITDGTKAMSFRVGAIFYLAAIILLLKDLFPELEKDEKIFLESAKEKAREERRLKEILTKDCD